MALLQFGMTKPKTVDAWTGTSEDYDKYKAEYNKYYFAWKAKRKKDSVEIRKGVCGANLLIVVDKSVNDPKETNAHCVSVSMNGTGVLTWQDITELKQAVMEAAAMLKNQ